MALMEASKDNMPPNDSQNEALRKRMAMSNSRNMIKRQTWLILIAGVYSRTVSGQDIKNVEEESQMNLTSSDS